MLGLIIVIQIVAVIHRGDDLAVVFYLSGCFIAIPLILIGIALICARQLSKSRFALLYFPVIGGLVAAACVPHLIHANLSAHLFRRYGIVYGLVGLVIGGLAFLISVVAEQHSAKDTPPGDSKAKS
jgi:hypothetical protein